MQNKGFSLIELMIVIAIISILAVMGMPSYQHYTQRARFAEVVSATHIFKIAVALALQQGIPVKEIKNGSHGIPTEIKPTKNLAAIKVEKGIITAEATELLNYATYILKPDAEGSLWNVSGTCLKTGLCHE